MNALPQFVFETTKKNHPGMKVQDRLQRVKPKYAIIRTNFLSNPNQKGIYGCGKNTRSQVIQ